MAVNQSTEGWQWGCECGATGTPTPDREKAREEFKEHRRTCAIAGVIKPDSENNGIMSTTAKKNRPTGSKPAAKKAVKPGESAPKKKRTPSVSATDAKAALARLKSGETTLIAESKRLGFTHNGPLRTALRELLGLEKYNDLMNSRKAETEKKKAAKKAPAKKPTAKKAVKKAAAKKSAAKKTAAPAAETTTEAPAEQPAAAPETAGASS